LQRISGEELLGPCHVAVAPPASDVADAVVVGDVVYD
jgi:hypothetical protein